MTLLKNRSPRGIAHSILLGLVFLFCLLNAHAAPPSIDIKPAVGNALIQDRWQNVVVTLNNPDNGDALQGEVQVSLSDSRTGAVLGTYARAVTLPGGAGKTQVPVAIYVPGRIAPPNLAVYVVKGTAKNNSAVTRRAFSKIPVLADTVQFIALTPDPNAFTALDSETIGVYRIGGVVRPGYPKNTPQNPNRRNQGAYRYSPTGDVERPLQVSVVTPADLPDRVAGYDIFSIFYIGNTAPDLLSDTQVNALKQWVENGGLLVVSGQRLQTDNRLRDWLPARWQTARDASLTPLLGRYGAPDSQVSRVAVAPLLPGPDTFPLTDNATKSLACWKRVGRGTIVALAFDPAEPPVSGLDTAVQRAFWRQITRVNLAPISIGAHANTQNNYGYYESLENAVVHAPGLRAPAFSFVGFFLLGYIILLIPLNYIVLKRLDKREWTWFTLPSLVLLFCVGAYAFGYSYKGRGIWRNVATIVELSNGSGNGEATSAIGLFSPALARYDVSLNLPGAVVYQSSDPNNQSNNSYGSLLVAEGDPAREGSTARNATINMWAMRTFSGHSAVSLQNGLKIDLTYNRNTLQVKGSVTNQTGRTLENVCLNLPGGKQVLGKMNPGDVKPVSLAVAQTGGGRGYYSSWDSIFTGMAGQPYQNPNLSRTPKNKEEDLKQNRDAIINGTALCAGSRLEGSAERFDQEAFVSAWCYDRLLPLQVNGRDINEGQDVNLLLVRTVVPGMPVQLPGDKNPVIIP